ncbi:MAG: hypothetical protein ACLFNZ_11970 [Spirochaetaceae bacterium]
MDILSSLDELKTEGTNRIENKSAVLASLVFFLRKETRKPALRIIRTIQRDFFLPQFQGRFNIRKMPVVWVDHPLDAEIPFRPQHVSIYLSFTHFWIRSIYFLYREFGAQTLPFIVRFVEDLTRLYKESALVYRKVQSTTNRPHHYGGFHFKVIHLFDPHLHCVPSLHVGVVGLTYLIITKLIDSFADNPQRYYPEKEYLWKRAVLITESILFIKQHSINCVAAGLYTLTACKFGYSKEESHRVIDALFTGEGNTLEDSEELREYIRSLYDHLMAEKERRMSIEGDAKPEPEINAGVLVDFLNNYEGYLHTWKTKGELPAAGQL